MKVRQFVGALALVAVTALVTQAVTQDGKGMDEMMAKMMELGTPGAEHQKMAEKVGKWDMELSHWMEPGGEASKSKGTSEMKMAMDGRYLVEKVTSAFDMGGMEMPFSGMAIAGYDKAKKKHVSTWIDSMSTSMMIMEGEMKGNVLTMEGMSYCCYSDGPAKFRTVLTDIDKDNFKFEMFGPGPDGKEFRSMEIVYKRSGAKNAQ